MLSSSNLFGISSSLWVHPCHVIAFFFFDAVDCLLRVDWHFLRRLLLSGAVVFNLKVFFTPNLEPRDEPGVPSYFSQILKHGKNDFMEYKETPLVEHILAPVIEAWQREHEEAGSVKEWNVATLEERPIFSG